MEASFTQQNKKFIWRALKNSLIVLCSLLRRGINVNVVCPVCSCADASLLHVLGDCHYARIFRALSNYPAALIHTDEQDVASWIRKIQQSIAGEMFEKFVCSCWSLWSNRNKVVHEKKNYEPQDAVYFVARYIEHYKEAQPHFGNPRPPEEQVLWSPPPVNTYKVNFHSLSSLNAQKQDWGSLFEIDAEMWWHGRGKSLSILARRNLQKPKLLYWLFNSPTTVVW